MMASRSEPEKEMAAIAIDAKTGPGLVGMFGPLAGRLRCRAHYLSLS